MTRASSSRDATAGALDRVDFNNLVKVVQSITSVLDQQIRNNNNNNSSNHTQQLAWNSNVDLLFKFVKLKPPTFLGERDPMIAEEWLMRIEKILKVMGCPSEQRVSLATFQLGGEAGFWWELKKESLAVGNEQITWDMFQEAFNREYFPKFIKDKKEFEFLELKQGNMSVMEYASSFTQLARFALYMVSDQRLKARQFQRGLSEEIQSMIAILQLTTYEEVLDRALIAEDFIKGPQETMRPVRGRKKRRRVMEGPCVNAPELNVCGADEMAHEYDPCPPDNRRCYRCGSTQHIVRMCPLRQ